MERLIEFLRLKRRAMEELKVLFDAIEERVYKFDEEGIFLPAERYEDEGYMVWELRKEKEEGQGEEVLEKKEDREAKEISSKEREQDEEYEGEGLCVEIGVYVWSGEEDEANLSVYAVISGETFEERWFFAKRLAKELEGIVYGNHPEWERDEVELKRYDLEDFEGAPERLDELARTIVELGKSLILRNSERNL